MVYGACTTKWSPGAIQVFQIFTRKSGFFILGISHPPQDLCGSDRSRNYEFGYVKNFLYTHSFSCENLCLVVIFSSTDVHMLKYPNTIWKPFWHHLRDIKFLDHLQNRFKIILHRLFSLDWWCILMRLRYKVIVYQ